MDFKKKKIKDVKAIMPCFACKNLWIIVCDRKLTEQELRLWFMGILFEHDKLSMEKNNE